MSTFAEIDLTFTDLFDFNTQTNVLSVSFSNQATQNSNDILERIVQTRSRAFEFSQGTDAATQAQFYKAAIDADFVPSGDWECTISGAVVTIKSTNADIFFNRVFTFAPNDTRVSAVIRNPANTTPTTAGKLLARSSYYLSFPIGNETFQNVKMYFRSGDTTAGLTTPNYQKKVLKPSDTWEYFDVLISRFALDFLKPKPVWQGTTGSLNSLTGSVLATTITTQSNAQLSPQNRITNVMTTRGYANYSSGANYLDTTTNILLTSTYNQVLAGDTIIVPVIAAGVTYQFKDEDGTLLQEFTTAESDVIEESIKYLFLTTANLTTGFITLNDTHIFEIVDECKFTPQNVLYLNKFGVFENLTFFKAKENTVEFTSEGEYKNNFVLGGQYDVTRHLYRSGNKNARESVTLNTGYLNELQNECIKDLLNSEYVYFNDSGTFVPVNLDKKSLSILSRINDKLINYAIDFKYSFDTIQNV